MKLVILAYIVLSSFFSSSQELYDYYRGYLAGYKKGCSCSNTPPNASKLYYHSGTYSDGFEDGHVDGRIFNNESQKSDSESQYYNPNLELIERVLKEKQERLDRHRSSLQALKNSYNELYNSNRSKLSEDELERLDQRVYNYKSFEAQADLSDYENYSKAYDFLKESIELLKYYLTN